MEHSEIILQILAERDITPYRLSKETGISESLFGAWRKKPTSKIYSGNLVLIADYLGCSVDYLLGRTENPDAHQES
ncbi:MAG: helix-turn-helix transcriptional regulator [Oscillospiraceae bacterium]|nr:helix-turn-helix transcriptional regulator [Oscillospiraceae bacterium]